MKQALTFLLIVTVVAAALNVVTAEEFRRCPNCEQVVYNTWWEYCPRCGAQLDTPKYTGSAAGIPPDPGYQVINNTYRNLPHLFRIDRPGATWEFVTGEALRDVNPGAVVEIAMPKTTVAIDVYAEKNAKDTLAGFMDRTLPVKEDLKLIHETKDIELHGRPMLRRDLMGKVRGRAVRLTLLATRDENRSYLITAMADADDYKRFGDEIEKAFKSFIFLDDKR